MKLINCKRKFHINLRPSSFILYGLIIYFFIYAINPFKYTIYSVEGVLYFILAYLFLYLGTLILEKMSIKQNNYSGVQYEVHISKRSELFLHFLSFLSIVSFIIYFNEVMRLPTKEYSFASEDLRLALSASRSTLNKITEMTMQIGPISYLIASNVSKLNYRRTMPLTMIAFFIPSLGILSVGARGVAVINIFIFLINSMLCKKRGVSKFNTGNVLKKITPILLVIGVTYFIFSLFVTRPGLSSTENMYLIYPGDIELKSFYKVINQNLNYSLDPLYKALMYYTHSFPVFTYFYINAPQIGIFFGVIQFSFMFFVLNALGLTVTNPNTIGLYNPAAGLYSTFASYFILDYGKALAIGMIFFSGVIFGLLFNSNKNGKFGFFIFPVILTMCIIAPIYYFWTVGRMDVLIFWYCLIYPILRVLGLKVKRIYIK